jgi:hypothetical protein
MLSIHGRFRLVRLAALARAKASRLRYGWRVKKAHILAQRLA